MIITRLRGGLGNQLFQYAAARALALKHGVELGLDVAFYAQPGDSARVDYRRYRLRRFAIAGRDLNVSHGQRRLYKRLPAWLGPLRFGVPQLVRQQRFEPGPWAEMIPAAAYLDGWWTSEDFFKAHAGQIRADLAPADPADRATADPGHVAVHVRRGDYLRLPDHHPPVTLGYLKAAMATFGPGQDFLVFSDDPDWCRAALAGGRVRIAEPGADEVIDLWRIAACAHQIIANSSFSWWAAWLNPNPAKRVIAPARWFGPAYRHFDTRRVIPADWQVIDA